MPRCAVSHRAPPCGQACATDPDRRMRFADWTRFRMDNLQRSIMSDERCHVRRPARLDDLKIFIGDRTPAVKVDSQSCKLEFRPAHSGTENEPAAADGVDVSDQPRSQEWMPIRNDRHTRSQFDST